MMALRKLAEEAYDNLVNEQTSNEVDYSDPNEKMCTSDLLTAALSSLELLRDCHWSDGEKIGIPLDDDDPDDPGTMDRLAATSRAIEATKILQGRISG